MEPGSDGLLGVFITSYCMRDLGTAFFLWGLEGPNPNETRHLILCVVLTREKGRAE